MRFILTNCYGIIIRMLKHPMFKKILKILISSGILVAIGFSAYGIYEWNMTRTFKTTGLFCPNEEADELDYFQQRSGELYKIEESKRYGIRKISVFSDEDWKGVRFSTNINSIQLGGGFYDNPRKGTVGWYMSSYSTIDRTTLIMKGYDADGNFLIGSKLQCEIDNNLIDRVEKKAKDRKEERARIYKILNDEIIEKRKI